MHSQENVSSAYAYGIFIILTAYSAVTAQLERAKPRSLGTGLPSFHQHYYHRGKLKGEGWSQLHYNALCHSSQLARSQGTLKDRTETFERERKTELLAYKEAPHQLEVRCSFEGNDTKSAQRPNRSRFCKLKIFAFLVKAVKRCCAAPPCPLSPRGLFLALSLSLPFPLLFHFRSCPLRRYLKSVLLLSFRIRFLSR